MGYNQRLFLRDMYNNQKRLTPIVSPLDALSNAESHLSYYWYSGFVDLARFCRNNSERYEKESITFAQSRAPELKRDFAATNLFERLYDHFFGPENYHLTASFLIPHEPVVVPLGGIAFTVQVSFGSHGPALVSVHGDDTLNTVNGSTVYPSLQPWEKYTSNVFKAIHNGWVKLQDAERTMQVPFTLCRFLCPNYDSRLPIESMHRDVVVMRNILSSYIPKRSLHLIRPHIGMPLSPSKK